MIRAAIAIIATIAIIGTIGSMDAADAAAEERGYCQMVAIWQQDAASGVPPMERGGWPPYRGQCD